VIAAQDYGHCDPKDLQKYEIFDYLPSHTLTFKHWIQRQPRIHKFNWDRLLVTAIIGVMTGLTGILMQQIFISAVDLKWEYTGHYLEVDH